MTIDKFLELKDSLELKTYVRSLNFDKKTAVHSMALLKNIPMKRIELFLLPIRLVNTPSIMNSILKIFYL